MHLFLLFVILTVNNNHKLTFIPLGPMLATGFVLVWKKGQFVSNLVNSFISYLRNVEKAFYDI